MGQYVMHSALEFEPGSRFEYSSGTTNLIGQLIRNQFDTHQDYLRFPYDRIINKLGLQSMYLETDDSGHYVLSSYCYATPRDWSKLGLLYLHGGVWNQDTIFTKEWLDYSIKPSPTQSSYGAHIWLNTNNNELKDCPDEMYKFSGYEGQYVYMLPSKNTVIVRTGLSEGPYFDLNAVIKTIVSALE
jgi:CubicO group peptidase (beta-lactamase class C family)